MNCEICAVELKWHKIVVYIYRSDYAYDNFSRSVYFKFKIAFDFNLNIMPNNKYNKSYVKKFKSEIMNCNCSYLLDAPTRKENESVKYIYSFVVIIDINQ